MERKQVYRLAVGIAAVGVAMLAMPSVVFAQEAAEKATFLTSQGAAWLGGAIGAGLAIMGGAAGIGRIGGSAVESLAFAASFFTTMKPSTIQSAPDIVTRAM